MSVGDVTSTERGSGARYNDGKPELAQIPVRLWIDSFAWADLCPAWLIDSLRNLAEYQETGEYARIRAAFQHIPTEVLCDAARVFTYGAIKYAQWNWAKGMPWSVPFNCALRHAAALAMGEETDQESGETHAAHYACNIVMLRWYIMYYPEGEDYINMRLTP